MYKLFIVFVLNGIPTGEGYIGKEYPSYEECMEAGKELIPYIGEITTANAGNYVCEYQGELA